MKTILDADERTSKAPGCMDCGSGSFIRLDCVRAVGEALFEVLIQWSVLAVWYRNTAMAGMVSFDGVVPDSGKYRHFRQCCQQQSNFDPPLFNNSSCNLTHLITQD